MIKVSHEGIDFWLLEIREGIVVTYDPAWVCFELTVAVANKFEVQTPNHKTIFYDVINEAQQEVVFKLILTSTWEVVVFVAFFIHKAESQEVRQEVFKLAHYAICLLLLCHRDLNQSWCHKYLSLPQTILVGLLKKHTKVSLVFFKIELENESLWKFLIGSLYRVELKGHLIY